MNHRHPIPVGPQAGSVVSIALTIVPLLVALLFGVTAVLGAPEASRPWSFDPAASLMPLARIDLVVMPPVDEEACRREDAREKEAHPDSPLRFAQPIGADFGPDNAGTWEELAAGARLWRLRIVSPGARSLNFGFTRYDLPPGAQLHLFAAMPAPDAGDEPAPSGTFDRSRWHVRGPHTAADRTPGGEFWSAIVPGDDAVLELFVPANAPFEPELRIGWVNHDYLGFGSGDPSKQGLCNNDVICPEGDPWRAEIRAVGVYTLNGAWTCTGTLLNSHDPARPPLFLTANHCAITTANDGTMVLYWNFESPTCGQLGGGSLAQSQNGCLLLAKNATSDFCLVRLEETPDAAFNVYYAGWDAREETRPSRAVGIHHPNCDEKAISFTESALSVTTYLADPTPGDGTHWRVIMWDDGTTEPGSSGSGIWDEDRRIVGQLHGGGASCEDPTASDWYGRLSRSWSGGGTAPTRLRDHLDPQSTGVLYIDGHDPAGGGDLAGDANVDGQVNVQDLVAMVNHILAVTPLSTQGVENADRNGDSRISVLDLVLVVNIILGKNAPAAESLALSPREVEALRVEVGGRAAVREPWDAPEKAALDVRLEGTSLSPSTELETLECTNQWQGIARVREDGTARVILYNLGGSGRQSPGEPFGVPLDEAVLSSAEAGSPVEAVWILPEGITRLALAGLEAATPHGALANVQATGFPILIQGEVGRANAADLLRLAVHPNPGPGAWRVELELRRAAGISLELYDTAGRRLAVRQAERLGAGATFLDWSPGAGGLEAPTGVYFLRVAVDGEPARTEKVLVIR